MKVELNVSVICEALEEMLELNYTEDINEGSEFWYYVERLENHFSNALDKGVEFFWDSFGDNYDDIRGWHEIYEYFEAEEEEELKCLGFRPQTIIGGCTGCKMVCEECELLMIVEEKEE